MRALLVPKLNQETTSNRVSTALLVLRVFVGIAFLVHGAAKIASPFNWMGPEAPVPGVLQALAALAEFGGGLGLIAGLLTPLVSLGLISTMVGAVLFHVGKGDAFAGGYELALAYLVVAGVFLLVGPGKFSLDFVITAKTTKAAKLESVSSHRASIA